MNTTSTRDIYVIIYTMIIFFPFHCIILVWSHLSLVEEYLSYRLYLDMRGIYVGFLFMLLKTLHLYDMRQRPGLKRISLVGTPTAWECSPPTGDPPLGKWCCYQKEHEMTLTLERHLRGYIRIC